MGIQYRNGQSILYSDRDSIIFHIDVNSAYLSWTALKRLADGDPVDLRTIPSIVGGDQKTRHGIVVAKSIPAKAYGIHTAETVASAFQKCPNLVMVPPEHGYYREQSRRLMKYLSGICPVIQQVSIDECYMSFDPIRDLYDSPETCAHRIKDGVRDTFGFTVNVGISNRKVLAKMASDFQKPDRVHTLYTGEIQDKMWPLPIEDLYMCGKSTAKRFRTMGINTIGELAQMDPALVDQWMKKHGRMLWNFANGIDDSVVEPETARAKGVGNSTTLSQNVTDAEEAKAVLKRLADQVSERLKKHDFLAGSVCVEIKYATFQSVSHQAPLDSETADAEKIFRSAAALFDELWNGDPVRLLGIRTTKLVDTDAPVQMNLFDYQEILNQEKKQKEKQLAAEKVKAKKEKMDAAMASIRKRFGENSISKGSAGIIDNNQKEKKQ